MDVFVARQPIFDKKQNVIAYELLFRSSKINAYPGIDADTATMNVISNGFLLFGMENLTGGKRAFINFTETLLKSDIASNLPSNMVVIEILENVEVTAEIIIACKKLRRMGYMLALDDFIYHPKYDPLIPLIDIIKVDFMLTKGRERKEVIDKISSISSHIQFLAERVETMEEYKGAIEDGYTFFQGYFFSKPMILSTKDMASTELSYNQLLSELLQDELDFHKLEKIIKRDVALSYKLLKYVNSASFGLKMKVESILHALTLLGKDDVLKWICYIALKESGGQKPDVLMSTSVIRAKFGEMLAPYVGLENRSSDLYFLGMLSLIHAIIDLPMETALAQIPIAEEIKEALMGHENWFKDVFDLMLAYESGQWDLFLALADKLALDASRAPEVYIKALEWADEFMHI